jgi:hypothetical protein
MRDMCRIVASIFFAFLAGMFFGIAERSHLAAQMIDENLPRSLGEAEVIPHD